MQINRLTQQIQFIIEIDQLKQVMRQTLLTDAGLFHSLKGADLQAFQAKKPGD